jgi:hypothetical protein
MTEKQKRQLKRNRLATVHGIVIPVRWDDRGNVLTVGISTHDEEEYLVEIQGKGRELFQFVRKEVEAYGLVRREAGKKIISVERYNLKSVNEQQGSGTQRL